MEDNVGRPIHHLAFVVDNVPSLHCPLWFAVAMGEGNQTDKRVDRSQHVDSIVKEACRQGGGDAS